MVNPPWPSSSKVSGGQLRTEFVDPYRNSETGILRNLVGARTPPELDSRESDRVYSRIVELDAVPKLIKRTADLQHLQAVHRHLFQDVYEWAGQLRTVDIRKLPNANSPGSGYFFPQAKLRNGAGNAFSQLRDDDCLQKLSDDNFISRLAFHYDQVNYLHPFREGNGRTQRIFWSQVAEAAGRNLDWTQVDSAEISESSRLAMDESDFSLLKSVLARVSVPPSPKRTQFAQRHSTVRGHKPPGKTDGGEFTTYQNSGPEVSLGD